MRNRLELSYRPSELAAFKEKIIRLASTETSACVLDSCGLDSAKQTGTYDWIIALGCRNSLTVRNPQDALKNLQEFHGEHRDWLFGVMSYDLKNGLHSPLYQDQQEANGFPLLHFFQPVHVVRCIRSTIIIDSLDEPSDLLELIENDDENGSLNIVGEAPVSTVDKAEYFEAIHRIKEEIRAGNVYEINYCLNHTLQLREKVNVMEAFKALTSISPAPFAGGFVHDNYGLISASPERYIRKTGRHLLSQPIKGTRRRGANQEEDLQHKMELQNSLKERAENVMIVDLVRNDLAHTCKSGSVKVSELFGIYSYEQVHQMVSTIEGEMNEESNWTEPLEHSFPMGSMTGAPKIAAMKLIDELEDFNRGWYSGSLGYITPGADFDFNVVIRSLLYNGHQKELSFAVGGAITYDSTAEEEWQECQLKALAIQKFLKQRLRS